MRCGVALAFLAGALHLAAPLSLLADEPACEGLSIPDGCPDPPDATSNCGCDWFENFESYPPGEIPPADPADPLNPVSNGWAGWYSNPGHLGEIDDAQDHTTGAGQSMRIDQGDDQVRWFLGRGLRNDGFGYDADVYPFWIFEAYVFIPDDHTDDHYLIMNSHYPRFPDDPDSLDFTCWHLQLEFNGRYDFVCNSLFQCFPGGPRLDLVRGRWANVRAEIDFEQELVLLFYDDNFLSGWMWAASIGGGPDTLFLGNLQLFSNTGNRAWFDDLSMTVPSDQIGRPDHECLLKNLDADGCAKFLWRLTNRNFAPPDDPDDVAIAQFYIDVDAGRGGRSQVCRGALNSVDAWTPPTGWTVTNCSTWTFPGQTGHALFRFDSTGPEFDIGPGETIAGYLTVDVNWSREFERPDDIVHVIHGKTIPAYTVLMSVAQYLGNEAWARCDGAPETFWFGPRQGGGQSWSAISRCEAPLNVPALSAWAKVVLAALLLAGGAWLVLRSRCVAAA